MTSSRPDEEKRREMGLEGEGRQEEHQNGEEAAAGGLCWTEAQDFGSTARLGSPARDSGECG